MLVTNAPTIDDMFVLVRVHIGTHTIEYDFAMPKLLVIGPNDRTNFQLAPKVLDILRSEALAHFQYAMQGTTDWTHLETLFACFGFSAQSPSRSIALKDRADDNKRLLTEITRLLTAKATDLILDCTCLDTIIVPATWDAKNFDYIGTSRHLPVLKPTAPSTNTGLPSQQSSQSKPSGSNTGSNSASLQSAGAATPAPLQAPAAVADPTFAATAMSPSTRPSDLLTDPSTSGPTQSAPVVYVEVLSSDLEPYPAMSVVVLSSDLKPDPPASSAASSADLVVPVAVLSSDLEPDPAMSPVVVSSDLALDHILPPASGEDNLPLPISLVSLGLHAHALSSNPDPCPALGEDKPDPGVSPIVLSSDLEPDPAGSPTASSVDLEPDPTVSPVVLSSDLEPDLETSLLVLSSDLEPDPILSPESGEDIMSLPISLISLGLHANALSADLEPDPALGEDKPDPAMCPNVLSSNLAPDPAVSSVALSADLELDPTMATLFKTVTVAILSSDLEPDPDVSSATSSGDLVVPVTVLSSDLEPDPAVSSTALSAALKPGPTAITLSKAVTVAVLSSDLEPDPAGSSTAWSADREPDPHVATLKTVTVATLSSDLEPDPDVSSAASSADLEPDPTALTLSKAITTAVLAPSVFVLSPTLGEDNTPLLASLVSLGQPAANAQPVDLAPLIQFTQSGEDTTVAPTFHLTQSGEDAIVATPFQLFISNIVAAPDGSTQPMTAGLLTSNLEPDLPSSIASTGGFTTNLELALEVALAMPLLANLAASRVPVFDATARALPAFVLGAPAGQLSMTAHSIAVALGHYLFAFYAVSSCDLAPDPQPSELLASTHNASTSISLNCHWKHPTQQSTCLLHSVLHA